MIRIRVDDFPQTKGEPQHSLAAFRTFHKTLMQCTGNKRYLLGVIPGRCSVDDILFLRNETDCIIGMHGIDHDESKLDTYQNEFPPYLSQSEIGRLLKEGRESLVAGVGRSCNIYMPPRNRIDFRTAMILPYVGFQWFTAGPETEMARDAVAGLGQILSLPPDEYGRTDEMWNRRSHKQLRLRSDAEDTVLTLHWTWETNIGLHHMVKFLTDIPVDRFAHFDE